MYVTLRQHGQMSSSYIDDSYLQEDDYEDCVKNVIDTLQVFDSPGFAVNRGKYVFIP